ncbi:MAG TPA: hypothetical protein VJ972_06415 [Anaerolineales bacterium]|nr:hypothetical protein [Anaerolineales bacterium]
MGVEFVNYTTVVVMIIIVIIAFFLLIVVNNRIGFDKANKFLLKLRRKDKIYVKIRNMLRGKLIPLGFMEEETVRFGNEVKYVRDGFLVELYFDIRERGYSFFASSGVQDPIFPPRQVSVMFFSTEKIDEKKKEIGDALQEWLKSIGL